MHSVLRFSYVWATIALNQWSPFTNPDAHASLDRRVPRARQRLAFLILARGLRLVLTLSFFGLQYLNPGGSPKDRVALRSSSFVPFSSTFQTQSLTTLVPQLLRTPRHLDSFTHTPTLVSLRALSAPPASLSPPSPEQSTPCLLALCRVTLADLLFRGYECEIVMPDDVAVSTAPLISRLSLNLTLLRL